MTASHERLIQAATVLRERAEAATSGPWMADREPGIGHVVSAPNAWVAVTGDEEGNDTDAAYIATVAPPLALAVATLLFNEAYMILAIEKNLDLHSYQNGARTHLLLDIASSVLGENEAV